MQTVYANLTSGWPPSDCLSAAGQGSYPPGPAQPTGDLGCAVNNSGQHVFVWTDTSLAILSIAASNSMSFGDLHRWWQGLSGSEPAPAGSADPAPQPLTGVTATLSTYFDSINARNYRQAWSQLSPADQSANPYPGFAAGQSTTTIRYWQLHGVAPGPVAGTYIASVTFQSHQNPSEAPDKSDSCDDWTLNYTMIQTSGRWLIDAAKPQPGVPAYQSCG
jgi:hypothetical protein